MPPRTLDRLVCIDDSGDPRTGLAVYGWIEFAPDRWHDVLGGWLEHRKQLWRKYGIPVSKELHMTEYVQGRGRLTDRHTCRSSRETAARRSTRRTSGAPSRVRGLR